MTDRKWISLQFYPARLTREDVLHVLILGTRYKYLAPEFGDCLSRFAGAEIYRRTMIADGARPRECELCSIPTDLPREELGPALSLVDSWLSNCDGSAAFLEFLRLVNLCLIGFTRAELGTPTD